MCTLFDAIEKKFESPEETTTDVEIVVFSGSPTTSGVLSLPPILVMDGAGISRVGDDVDRLTDACRHVTELDVSNNSFADWSELLSLMRRLPRLRWVNLSRNCQLMPATMLQQQQQQQPQLTQLDTLILNNLSVDWRLLFNLLELAPNLRELHACSSGLRDMQADNARRQFNKLQLLFCNGNRLNRREDWLTIGRTFPSLTKLTIIDNDIDKLPNCATVLENLKNLESLNLSENLIDNWGEIDKLRQFPALRDVRLLDVALAKRLPRARFRSEVIARLPAVATLNGTPVHDEERVNAERAFIRCYMNEEERPDRLQELELVHGKLDELAKVSLRPYSEVSIVVSYEQQRKLLRLPTTATIGEVKRLICAELGASQSRSHVFYVDQGIVGVYGPERLDFNGRAFHSYRPEDGDELIIRDK